MEQHKYKDDFLSAQNRLPNLLTPTVKPLQLLKPLLEAYTESSGCELLYKLMETNAFDYSNLPVVRDNIVGDPVWKTFENLWKNKKNYGAGWFLPASLD